MKPGASLGPFRIDRELGSGGMGKVYAASGPDGVVALKVVHPHLLETPGFFKRFMREAQLGQAIRHENVVRTLDCDQEFTDGKPQCFLVMEYVEGQTLSELLGELERVPEELCRHVAREICKGLAAIHDAGVVHRDLKPENVLITPQHVVKIMDLGIAQVADEALRLSKDGAFVGSVEYAAPEQFKGGDVDGRTDLHGLGVLLYELSSGTHPYRGGGFHDAMQRVCESEPQRLGEVNPQLSAFFEEVVHTLLVKDPRGRFASARQLLVVLEDGERSAWWHDRARLLQETTRRPLRRIRVPRETAVYGRESELEQLRGCFARASSGDGQVVLIEGEAGIGKSRLVDELIARLQDAGEDLNFLFGSYPPGGAATANGAFSSAFHEHFGEEGAAAYLAETPLLVPAFDALLRSDAPPPDAQPLTRESVVSCFVQAMRSLGAERTTVVLIDDLHFATEDGHALFSALAMAVPGHRVVLIGTARPGISEAWRAGLTRLPQTTPIAVQRLGPKDLVELLRDSFRSEALASSLAAQIALKSDGNPFFAFEIIRGLREGQFITQGADGTWTSTRVIEDIQIPSSILDLVNARVAGLTEDERALLDVAACAGYEFDPTLVGDIMGMARIPALRAFGQIERQHRLVRAAGRSIVFDHHQVQEALYGSLLEPLREEYHAAIAERMEALAGGVSADPATLDGPLCVALCEHFLKGARGESALRYVERASRHLARGHQHAQVAALERGVLAVPGLLHGEPRVRALLRLEAALDALGRKADQRAALDEAVAIADASGGTSLRARAHWRRGHFLEMARELEDASTELELAGELAAAAGDRSLMASVTHCTGTMLYFGARNEEAEAVFRGLIDTWRELGNDAHTARTLSSLGLVLAALGRFDDARASHEESLELLRSSPDPTAARSTLANLGNVAREQDRWAEAKDLYERSLALHRAAGARRDEATVTANIGVVFASEGRLDEARRWYEQALEIQREIGDRSGELRTLLSLGVAFARQGRLADAQEQFEQLLTAARESGAAGTLALALGNLGATMRAQGRLAEARELFEQQLVLHREQGNRGGISVTEHNLGVVAREEGDDARSETHLLTCLELCGELGQRYIEAATQLLLAELRIDAGRHDDACEMLAAARDTAHEIGVAGVEALARCRLATLPSGDPDDALAAAAQLGKNLAKEERPRFHWLVWKATGDREHLRASKRELDEILARVPEELHESMCTNLGHYREIMTAWRVEIGGDDDATDGGPTTESPTRAG
jgi:serine/threonine protein kinase/tetratricopeptide (TPR) repeat protein